MMKNRTVLPAGILLLGFAACYWFFGEGDVFAFYGVTAGIAGVVLAALSSGRVLAELPEGESSRKGWIRLVIGLWIWVVASMMELFELWLGQPAYATLADGFWLFGYMALFGALTWMVKNEPHRSGLPLIAGLTLLGFLLIFYFFIFPQVEDMQRGFISKVLDVAYPALDSVLLGFSAFLFRISRLNSNPIAPTYGILAVAFAVLLFSDVILSYESRGESLLYRLLDIPYFCSYVLVAIGSEIHPSLAGKR